MNVTVEDLFLDISFDDIDDPIDINELKRLNSLLGGQTLYINWGDHKHKKNSEARFEVTSKYKAHFISHLQELGFVVIKKEAERES